MAEADGPVRQDLRPALSARGTAVPAGAVAPEQEAAEFVGTPDDEGEWGHGGELRPGQRLGAEEPVHGGQAHQDASNASATAIPASKDRLVNTPTLHDDAWSLR